MTKNDSLILERREALRADLGDRQALRAEKAFGATPVEACLEPSVIWGATDLTILKPEATWAQVEALCERAIDVSAAAVCVNGLFVDRVARVLEGSSVMPITVVGFPLGSSAAGGVAEEARWAVERAGAKEIDMVFPVGLLKGGEYRAAWEYVNCVVLASHAPVKVILETCLLTPREIVDACLISETAGAAFVKTSTGFSAAGATVEHVELMRRTVGDAIGVKASGGIRTFEDAAAMLRAGATRIGTSGLS